MVVFLSPLASIPLMTKEASSFNALSCDCIEQIVLAQCYSKKLSKTYLLLKYCLLNWNITVFVVSPWSGSGSGVTSAIARSQFVMYRDTDLPAVLKHSQCILVADDTTVYISGINEPVLRQLIEYDLASLTDWFHANKLHLDVLKTNFMKI